MRAPLVVACLLVTSSAVWAQQDPGPFGLRMGMSRSEVAKVTGPSKEGAPGVLSVTSVPKTHAAFESYQLIVSPAHGLCSVKAIGLNVTLNAFGDRLKKAFGEIVEAIDAKYGAHKMADYLQPGSIWNDPQDWAMGLFKEERQLTAYWSLVSQPGNIEVIALEAKALSTTVGYVTLTYQSPQASRCIDEVQQAKRSVF